MSTYRPYFEELNNAPETDFLKKSTKSSANRSSGVAVIKVLETLTPRYTEVLQVLATLQRANDHVSYANLFQACKKKFLTPTDHHLRKLMKEFIDHKLISMVKDEDGVELVSIPYSKRQLQEILDFVR